MKINFLLLLLIPFLINAQKAKSTGIKSNYHYIHYAIDESYNAPIYGLTITEQSSCGGLVPYKVMKTPLTSPDRRTHLYVGSFPSQSKYFMQAKDLLGNLFTKHLIFTHFEIDANNIVLNNQRTKNAKKLGPDTPDLLYLEFEYRVPVKVKGTYHGNQSFVTLDTNSAAIGARTIRFPMDFQFGTNGPDALRNGYPTEVALLSAWNKYGKKAQVQWRDKSISNFLVPLFVYYKTKYISYEEYAQCKIYSDKNKKGGYEELVHAANLFIGTLNKIEGDYKMGKHKKYWTKEHQASFSECRKIWELFFERNGMDLTKGSGDISAEYKQKVFLNYLCSLSFTGKFDEAEKLIAENIGKKLKSGTLFDLRRFRRLNNYLKREYEAHWREKGWVRE